MEKVTVKTINPQYSGYVRGFKFLKGTAEVPLKDAEAMKEFKIEIVKPKAVKPVKVEPVAKPKPKTQAKKAGE
jgi:hypothetical protein